MPCRRSVGPHDDVADLRHCASRKKLGKTA